MYKATIAIAALLGGVGAFLGVVLLSSGPEGAPARMLDLSVSDMRPPPLEPASTPDLGGFDSPMVDAIHLNEVQLSPPPHRAVAPHAVHTATPRELHPCSEWEEVGPKSLQSADGPVEMQHARLLC
jgi:hypothetical protein